MPIRTLKAYGASWRVAPSGLVTQYERDEFGLVFTREGTTPGVAPERRVTRYSPGATRSREQSLAELSDAELVDLLAKSQPSATSPETQYHGRRRTAGASPTPAQ